MPEAIRFRSDRASAAAGSTATALRIGLTWFLMAGAIHLAARTPLMWGVRLAVPYLTWPVLVPFVVWRTSRVPLLGWRSILDHLPLALALAVLHGLLFRAVFWALGGSFGPPPPVTNVPMILAIALSLYFSTAWAVSALRESRHADDADLARARTDAALANNELAATLGRLGPRQLDALLARLRQVIATPDRSADAAVDALATYLRVGLATVDAAEWSLDRELEAVGRYLDFEAACAGRPVELVVDRPIATGAPLRRYALVSAAGDLLQRVPPPVSLRLARLADGYALHAEQAGTRIDGVWVEVPA